VAEESGVEVASIVFVNRAGRLSGAEVVLLKLVQVACERGYRVRVVSCRTADGATAGLKIVGVAKLTRTRPVDT
jgi:hypothetical protein